MSYEDQTNDQLRTELERRGLSTAGNKDDLVARLEVDDAEKDPGASPDDAPGDDAGDGSAPGDDAGPGDDDPGPAETQATPAQPAEGGSTVQGSPVTERTTAAVTTGVPVQKRDENQDAAIKGRVTNERGDPAA